MTDVEWLSQEWVNYLFSWLAGNNKRCVRISVEIDECNRKSCVLEAFDSKESKVLGPVKGLSLIGNLFKLGYELHISERQRRIG